MPKGERLDLVAVELGLFSSREAARAAIMDGAVLINGLKCTKPGTPVHKDAKVELHSGYGERRFASRGGLKLEKALGQFKIVVTDRICLDIGASTGGFTDCLLKNGAARVYAVDVGYGQLDWSLRNNQRVVVKERLNARYLNSDILYNAGDALADLCVVDVSFIAVSKVLPACISVMSDQKCEFVLLIKPQFEAGKEFVGKGGVVRDQNQHIRVLEEVACQISNLELSVVGVTHSPVKGPAGNIEFLMHAAKAGTKAALNWPELVERAHQELKSR